MKETLLRIAAPWALPMALRIHQFTYKVISRLAVVFHGGVHPKHRIIRYEDWFLEKIKPGTRVYEVGCHDGQMSKKLAEKASEVVAIEIVPKMIEKARRNNALPRIQYIEGDATRYKPEGQFGCVVLSNVLEHIENRIPFLTDLRNNLSGSDGVTFLIRVPLITREWVAVYKRERGLEYRLDPTHFTEYTEEELRQELLDAGLRIESFDVRFGEAFVVCR